MIDWLDIATALIVFASWCWVGWLLLRPDPTTDELATRRKRRTHD